MVRSRNRTRPRTYKVKNNIFKDDFQSCVLEEKEGEKKHLSIKLNKFNYKSSRWQIISFSKCTYALEKTERKTYRIRKLQDTKKKRTNQQKMERRKQVAIKSCGTRYRKRQKLSKDAEMCRLDDSDSTSEVVCLGEAPSRSSTSLPTVSQKLNGVINSNTDNEDHNYSIASDTKNTEHNINQEKKSIDTITNDDQLFKGTGGSPASISEKGPPDVEKGPDESILISEKSNDSLEGNGHEILLDKEETSEEIEQALTSDLKSEGPVLSDDEIEVPNTYAPSDTDSSEPKGVVACSTPDLEGVVACSEDLDRDQSSNTLLNINHHSKTNGNESNVIEQPPLKKKKLDTIISDVIMSTYQHEPIISLINETDAKMNDSKEAAQKKPLVSSLPFETTKQFIRQIKELEKWEKRAKELEKKILEFETSKKMPEMKNAVVQTDLSIKIQPGCSQRELLIPPTPSTTPPQPNGSPLKPPERNKTDAAPRATSAVTVSGPGILRLPTQAPPPPSGQKQPELAAAATTAASSPSPLQLPQTSSPSLPPPPPPVTSPKNAATSVSTNVATATSGLLTTTTCNVVSTTTVTTVSTNVTAAETSGSNTTTTPSATSTASTITDTDSDSSYLKKLASSSLEQLLANQSGLKLNAAISNPVLATTTASPSATTTASPRVSTATAVTMAIPPKSLPSATAPSNAAITTPSNAVAFIDLTSERSPALPQPIHSQLLSLNQQNCNLSSANNISRVVNAVVNSTRVLTTPQQAAIIGNKITAPLFAVPTAIATTIPTTLGMVNLVTAASATAPSALRQTLAVPIVQPREVQLLTAAPILSTIAQQVQAASQNTRAPPQTVRLQTAPPPPPQNLRSRYAPRLTLANPKATQGGGVMTPRAAAASSNFMVQHQPQPQSQPQPQLQPQSQSQQNPRFLSHLLQAGNQSVSPTAQQQPFSSDKTLNEFQTHLETLQGKKRTLQYRLGSRSDPIGQQSEILNQLKEIELQEKVINRQIAEKVNASQSKRGSTATVRSQLVEYRQQGETNKQLVSMGGGGGGSGPPPNGINPVRVLQSALNAAPATPLQGVMRPMQQQPPRHPAPLPVLAQPQPLKPITAALRSPGRPILKLSKVQTGIVLSWSMTIDPGWAQIEHYLLYAYQENNGLPSTNLWKKIGEVRALPLPMACTLTQFQSGSIYHFSVCAVDVFHRPGPFSDPAHIDLPNV